MNVTVEDPCRLLRLLAVTLLGEGEGDCWSELTMSITTASSLRLPPPLATASPPGREVRGGDGALAHWDVGPYRDPPVDTAFLSRPAIALSDLEGGWSGDREFGVQLPATSRDAAWELCR